jgi:hypothetical protein
MHEDIPSFTEILSLWTDDDQLVADLGLPPSARSRVRRWRERNSVRPQYWQPLIDMADKRFGLVLTPRHLMLAACGQHRPFVKQPKVDNDAEAA